MVPGHHNGAHFASSLGADRAGIRVDGRLSAARSESEEVRDSRVGSLIMTSGATARSGVTRPSDSDERSDEATLTLIISNPTYPLTPTA